jgi:hypothetical protein
MPAIELSKRAPQLKPGERVRIIQQIYGRDLAWTTTVEGEVLSSKPEPTGSWFAHGKRQKFWLLRVRLRKADGEVTTVAIDQNSIVQRLG